MVPLPNHHGAAVVDVVVPVSDTVELVGHGWRRRRSRVHGGGVEALLLRARRVELRGASAAAARRRRLGGRLALALKWRGERLEVSVQELGVAAWLGLGLG
jgi:hypothetical protein